LAATGIDAGPLLLVGAALLVVGIVVAVVVARRGHRHAATFAVLPLALGLLLGAGLISATPAQAATPGSCSTPTPTPTCTPAAPVADRTIDDLEWTLVDDTFSTTADPADVTAMLGDQAAIAAVDSHATFVVSYDFDGTPPSPDSAGNAVSSHDLSGSAGTVSFVSTVQPPPSVLGNVTYTVTFHIDWTYANGCGGTLTTHQTFDGTILVIGGTE
jgi:hypothetical protein